MGPELGFKIALIGSMVVFLISMFGWKLYQQSVKESQGVPTFGMSVAWFVFKALMLFFLAIILFIAMLVTSLRS